MVGRMRGELQRFMFTAPLPLNRTDKRLAATGCWWEYTKSALDWKASRHPRRSRSSELGRLRMRVGLHWIQGLPVRLRLTPRGGSSTGRALDTFPPNVAWAGP